MTRLRGLSGTCLIGMFASFATPPASAGCDDNFTVLHTFIRDDGHHPYAGLVADKAGNRYGTTVDGGNGCHRRACGTVFKIGAGNVETVLYSFRFSDGANPYGGVILDDAGNLYGTTIAGGSTECTGGCGTVFRLATDGTYSVLHAFEGGVNDGNSPQASLIADKAGNLYGTTSGGGAVEHTNGPGTVFKLAPDGTFNLLHVFGGPGDGQHPQAVVIMDGQGNLYGTTTSGGAYDRGTAFKLAPDGTETVLHSFGASKQDGMNPRGGLLLDSAGNLYGTTDGGGGKSRNCYIGCGTVFKLTPDGSENVLYAFRGGKHGTGPQANLIFDGAGNLLGTTIGGGDLGSVIFKLAPDGTETVLQYLKGGDGAASFAGLIADAAGNLYGTAAYGGKGSFGGYGTVFSLRECMPAAR